MTQISQKDDIERALEASIRILGETEWYSVLHFMRFKKTLEMIKENISSNIFEKKMILEIGSWPGYLTLAFLRMGCKVNAIDIEPDRLKKINDPNLSILKADINNIDKLPFQNNYFDAVVMTETIEHFSEKKILMILSEIKRTAKPGSCILISTPNRFRLGNIMRFWKQEENAAKGPGWGHAKEYAIWELEKYIRQSALEIKIMKLDNFYSKVGKSAKNDYFYPLSSFFSHKNKVYNFSKLISIPVTFAFSFFRDSIIIVLKKRKNT